MTSTLATLLESAGEILTWIMSLLGTVMTTITSTPILFAFVLLGLVGSAIFLVIKIARRLGLRRR